MTKIKLCGITHTSEILEVNRLAPEYIGFVFWEKSRRNLKKDEAAWLKSHLDKGIKAVGVFVDPDPEFVADLVNSGIIDMVQLHGNEDEDYIRTLRELLPEGTEIIKAFKVESEEEALRAEASGADHILFDPGRGDGQSFDWKILKNVKRQYFLAGGLNCDNISEAVNTLKPFAVDVSSGIETRGLKDTAKMTEFVNIVRNCYAGEEGYND